MADVLTPAQWERIKRGLKLLESLAPRLAALEQKTQGITGDQNYQPVRRASGSPVHTDVGLSGRDMWPGKIVWMPSDETMSDIADCWILPDTEGVPPFLNTPCIGVQNGYYDDGEGSVLPVFWTFGGQSILCPGTSGVTGYVEGGDNILKLGDDGCVTALQAEECP